MSTTYHSNIATGAPANASTFNTPLGDLDAAIGALDTTLDNIIIGSGTSPAEVIAAREGYALLDDRLDDLYLANKTLLVDASFAVSNTAAGRFTTISLALAACVGGETILIAPGIYTSNPTIAVDGVKLIGSGAPNFDSASGRLVNGTIIRGRLTLGTSVGVQVHHLGVDVVGVNSVDCITSTIGNNNAFRRFSHLTLLGNGNAALAHGLYLDGHYNNVDNVRVYNCYHGCAVHGSYSNINNVTFVNCSSSALIIKAKSGINCYGVNVNNVVMIGDPAAVTTRSGPLAIQAEDGVEVRRCNISNVSARYCSVGVINVTRNDALAGSVISEITFTNIASDGNLDNAVKGDYWIKTGNNIMLAHCRSTNRTSGLAYYADPSDNVGDVYLVNAYCDVGTSVTGNFIFRQLNHLVYAPEGFSLGPITSSSFVVSGIQGATNSTSVSVTAANTPVATLSNANGSTNDWGGMIYVWVRGATSSAAAIASYILHVEKGNSAGPGIAEISKLGSIVGAGATHPSFTFTLNTSNQLLATPIASASGPFWFTFVALGNLRVTAMN